jgi:DNA-binding XRE family transcriptional regulator
VSATPAQVRNARCLGRLMAGPAQGPPGSPATPPSAGSRPARPQSYVLDGPRLRRLRRQHGWSQEELADRAGISVTTVAKLERQPHPSCRGRTLARLAAALGERPAAFILTS